MNVEQYSRRPFDVDAVRVTEENMEEVAKWCSGDVRTAKRGKKDVKYIKVRVFKALDERQSQAFVGDWVLYAGTGYKVYMNPAFERSFEAKQSSIPEQRAAV